MKQKWMILACCFSCAPIMAQSNVQLYGNVDYGYSYRWNAYKGSHVPKSNSKIDGGLSSDNMIGFKGKEELGNNWSTFFVLERSFHLDSGLDGDGFDLGAYVGIQNAYGTLMGGRMLTPYHELLSSIDPFEASSVGTYQNIKKDIAQSAFGEAALFDPDRVNNVVTYVSPEINGFNFTLAYANNAFDADSLSHHSDNNHVWSLGVNYQTEQALMGLTYHQINVGNVLKKEAENPLHQVDNLSVGGFYDFEKIKLSAFYSLDQAKLAYNAQMGGKNKVVQNNFLIGANVPFGKNEIKASVQYSQNNAAQLGNSIQAALGYDYNFSKRTTWFAVYSWIGNDHNRIATTNDTQNESSAYQQALQLGIRHAF